MKFVASDNSVLSEPDDKIGLERTVSLIGAVSLIAGTMIGKPHCVEPNHFFIASAH